MYSLLIKFVLAIACLCVAVRVIDYYLAKTRIKFRLGSWLYKNGVDVVCWPLKKLWAVIAKRLGGGK